jgi:membrane protein DedA with SNARE-associated domain
VTKLLVDYGLVLLFVLVAIESAGIPLPGETALVTAAVLAHNHWGIEWVIVVAAGGAIVLERWRVTRRYAERALPPAERFFQKHGGKTVFFGRFFAFLRVTAAWLAGISRMHWWQFAAWNALGGIVWATGIGLLAYWAGKAAGDAVGTYGLYAVGVLVVVGVVAFVGHRVWKKRVEASA